MKTRVQPDPIHDQLMDRLDDWVENALDPQAAAAGLRAALTVCLTWERSSLRWEDQLPVPTWVGEIRRQVAEALGVELVPASPVSPAPDTEEA